MSDITKSMPVYLTSEFLNGALEHGLQQLNLKIIDLELSNITRGGENYCSNIYRAKIKFANVNNEFMETALIIKIMPEEKQAVLARLQIYNKETIFYLHIKPRIEALMWTVSSQDEQWILGARHYYSTTHPEQTIILEDLCSAGYQLKCRQLGLDMPHASLVMTKLAQYHASTMVIAEREPQTIIDRYEIGLLHVDAIKSEAFQLLFGTQLLKLASLVSNCEGFGKIATKLYRYHEHFTERILTSVYPMHGTLNVLNHGDLWVNNIFFKYDEHYKPKDIRVIDFQLCFYGSLGFDINYFLNTSLEFDTLKTHRQFLINIYYDAFTNCLRKLPYHKPLPTYECVIKEIGERESYGFFVSFGFFPLMSMVDVDSEDNTLKNLHNEEFARRKVQLMFDGNTRTLESLKLTLKRLDELGIFD